MILKNEIVVILAKILFMTYKQSEVMEIKRRPLQTLWQCGRRKNSETERSREAEESGHHVRVNTIRRIGRLDGYF